MLTQPEVGKFLLAANKHIIDSDLNEFFLWHGTDPGTVDILAAQDFDERVATLGGLYGGGSYFADAACKSTQYASTTNA